MKEIKIILQFDQKGKGFTDTELYQDIHNRLINSQVATHVTWESNPHPMVVDNNIIHVEIPYKIKNDINPSKLTIENIKVALDGLIEKHGSCSNLQITY